MKLSAFSMKEVEAALEKYHAVVHAAKMAKTTEKTYLLHADNFVRWLKGEFEPGKNKRLSN